MYYILWMLHSPLRWPVIALMLLTLSLWNWLNRKPFTPGIERLFNLFRLSLGIEVSLGLMLYLGLRPINMAHFRTGLQGAGEWPQVIFTFLHPMGMMLAFLACRAGQQRASLVVMAIMVVNIPWPAGHCSDKGCNGQAFPTIGSAQEQRQR